MHQRSGLAIRELEKSNYQAHKAGDRYYIKKCRHLRRTPTHCLSVTLTVSVFPVLALLHNFGVLTLVFGFEVCGIGCHACFSLEGVRS
jgi:hypothetical protein